jgi:hypothetical protein
MTWSDGGIWAVEGGQSSADVGRLIAWHATNGLTGIGSPLDLRVMAMDVPSGEVQVMPGTCSVPVKALGKTRQTYVGANVGTDTIPVPSTGSSGGRSDLIVVRVENPISGEPWQAPDDPITGQYIYTRRYPDVPNTTTHVNQVDPSASAITLARIDIPSNTGTITQNMIKDLRGQSLIEQGEPPLPTTPMASATQDFYDAISFDRASVTEQYLLYTDRSYKLWPSMASWDITVPSTATEAVVNIQIHCEQRPTQGQDPASGRWGHTWGYARLRMVGTGVDYSVDTEFDRDYVGGGTPTTVMIPIGGKIPIPANARGKKLRFQCEARMFDDFMTRGHLAIAKGSYIHSHIHFNVLPASS